MEYLIGLKLRYRNKKVTFKENLYCMACLIRVVLFILYPGNNWKRDYVKIFSIQLIQTVIVNTYYFFGHEQLIMFKKIKKWLFINQIAIC
jgi:hypothetical protein